MRPLAGEARTLEPGPNPIPFPALSDLGVTLTWVGGICAAAGIAVRVLALVYPPLAAFAVLAGFAGIGGAAVTVTGATCQYLADSPGIVLSAALVCAGVVVWWYWPAIRRSINRRLDGKS